jgi:hypothetical protein
VSNATDDYHTVVMITDWEPRPGIALIWFGAVFIGLSIVRFATGEAPDPRCPQFEIANCAMGLGLLFWGWSRLRRAKVTRPDLTWRQFVLTDEIFALIFVVALIGALAGVPMEQREALMRSLLEFIDTLRIARGL